MDMSIKTLSLKELRGLISESGLSSADCVEKAELQQRVGEALVRLKTDGAAVGPIAARVLKAEAEATEQQAPATHKEDTPQPLEQEYEAVGSESAEGEGEEVIDPTPFSGVQADESSAAIEARRAELIATILSVREARATAEKNVAALHLKAEQASGGWSSELLDGDELDVKGDAAEAGDPTVAAIEAKRAEVMARVAAARAAQALAEAAKGSSSQGRKVNLDDLLDEVRES